MEKEKLRFVDKPLMICALLISAMGLLVIYSATRATDPTLFYKQVIWVGTGIALMVGFMFIPRKLLYNFSYWIYIMTIILLVLLLLINRSSQTKRWLDLELFQLQPSELAKLGFILALAVILSVKKGIISRPNELIVPFIITLVPFLLVLVEPDLGTAIVFPAILILVLFIKGIKLRMLFFILTPIVSFLTAFNWISWIVFIIILTIFLFIYRQGFVYSFSLFAANSVVGTVTPVVWTHLKPYQQQRVLSFFNPGADPLGAGWHILQSKIAIGSGGLFGKGFLHGTQNKLFFLPEQHTDFVFSVVGEEWGLVGVLILLILFFFLLVRITVIMRSTRSGWGVFLLAGIMSYFAFQMFLNVGMCVNILPVAGLPLPLMSYGGSQTVLSFILIGIALNMGYNRYEY